MSIWHLPNASAVNAGSLLKSILLQCTNIVEVMPMRTECVYQLLRALTSSSELYTKCVDK